METGLLQIGQVAQRTGSSLRTISAAARMRVEALRAELAVAEGFAGTLAGHLAAERG